MTARSLLLTALISAAPFAAAQLPLGSIATPAGARDSRLQIPVVIPSITVAKGSKLLLLPPARATLTASNSICYTMRSYEFSQPVVPSGIPQLSGVTTCQPASKSHLRTTILAPAAQK